MSFLFHGFLGGYFFYFDSDPTSLLVHSSVSPSIALNIVEASSSKKSEIKTQDSSDNVKKSKKKIKENKKKSTPVQKFRSVPETPLTIKKEQNSSSLNPESTTAKSSSIDLKSREKIKKNKKESRLVEKSNPVPETPLTTKKEQDFSPSSPESSTIKNSSIDSKSIAQATENNSKTSKTPWVSPSLLLYKLSPRYPSESVEREEEGMVILSVTVAEEGKVVTAWIKKSSGYPSLDQSALETIREWVFVSDITKRDRRFLVPIQFSLKS